MMAKSIYITHKEFPDQLDGLNTLADAIKQQTGVRPSVRKLAAEILYDGTHRRIDDIQHVKEPSAA